MELKAGTRWREAGSAKLAAEINYNHEDFSMKLVKELQMMIVVGAVAALAATPGYSQTAAPPKPTGTAPATQAPATPPAGTPPAAPPTAAPAPQAPRPFPEGAKFAFVDIQAVASNSAEGKAATAKLDEMKKKKNGDLLAKNTALKSMQDKLSAGGTVLNDQARGQLEKDIEKAQRDLQFAQQDAQTELSEMTNQLQADFQEKLNPVLESIRSEKGLLMIFSIRDSGVVAAEAGLDLSGEVVKRFDAANKTAPAAAPAPKK
jgi:outer membrane protein